MTRRRAKRTSMLPPLDRYVLLGLLGLVFCAFLSTWIASHDFLPGARLFPYVVAIAGSLLTLVAMLRVWMGSEPAGGPGQTIPEADDDALSAYRTAVLIIGGIVAYYIAIWLLGFIVATALLLVGFARVYRQSYLYAGVTACAALIFVYTINVTLDLHLPAGWLATRLF
jgi:hypothetical protein